MSGHLERLIRLRRTEVDHQRQVVMVAAAEVDARQRQIEDLRASRQHELAQPAPDPRVLGAYLGRMQRREAVLCEELGRARTAHDAQAQRLLELRLELRRLEILSERQRARERREVARGEQRALDDLARARQGSRWD